MRSQLSRKTTNKGKRFLGVRFVNCACYGRLYQNDEGTAYVGSCPRCGKCYQARIGEKGTDNRMFMAAC
ncbi:MAG: hypothetical protein HN763_05700 [Opitutales bacterium]|jgi:hypothetical protein|nr:hypothetical protein [Opitutales bacterium]MBT7865841.1 hypothetical protein [Opitutales bacterium]